MGEYRNGKWFATFGDVQAGIADEAPGEGKFSIPEETGATISRFVIKMGDKYYQKGEFGARHWVPIWEATLLKDKPDSCYFPNCQIFIIDVTYKEAYDVTV